MSDALTVTKAHGAVIATRPARQPLTDMPRSGLPSHVQLSAVADSMPMNAAVLVVMNMCEIALGSAAIVDPGLNPNQPSQSTKQPMTPDVMLWPGIGCDLPAGAVLPEARPEHDDAGERRPAADAVHDGRSGEVPEAGRREPAAAPDPVAGDRIDERDEEEREHDEREVLDALGHRAGHDRGGRAGEHELEEELRVERDAGPRDRLVGAACRRHPSPGCCRRRRSRTAPPCPMKPLPLPNIRPQPNT